MASLGLEVSWGPFGRNPGVCGACYKRGSEVGYEWLLSLGPKDFSSSGEGNNHKKSREGPSKRQAQGSTTSCLGLGVGL